MTCYIQINEENEAPSKVEGDGNKNRILVLRKMYVFCLDYRKVIPHINLNQILERKHLEILCHIQVHYTLIITPNL